MKASTLVLIGAAAVAAYVLLGRSGGGTSTVVRTGPAGAPGKSAGVAAIEAGASIVGDLLKGWFSSVGEEGGGDVISDPTYDLDV